MLYQMSYFRLLLQSVITQRTNSINLLLSGSLLLVGRGGFEPPKSKQQIYSLPHLATLVSPRQKAILKSTEPMEGFEPPTS